MQGLEPAPGGNMYIYIYIFFFHPPYLHEAFFAILQTVAVSLNPKPYPLQGLYAAEVRGLGWKGPLPVALRRLQRRQPLGLRNSQTP